MRQMFGPRRGGMSGTRWLLFAVLCGLMGWLASGEAAKLWAQDPAAKGEAKDAAPPKDEPQAPAANPPSNGNAPANPAPAAGTAPEGPQNLLSLAIKASGPIGAFLLLLSVYFTALVIRLFMELRVSEAVPAPLVERLENAIRDKKFQDAYDACKDNDSFLARLVRVGIANLPNGRQEAKETMLEASDEVTTSLEMKISYLAIIGTLGPMIGLVGTIAGMIDSFKEIAMAGGAQPRPEKVAMGISMALFITLEGVSLSVPAIFFFAFFRNRIAQMTMEATRVADRTINSLVAAAKAAKTA
jgi:biopolymer transport protein ExbB